MGPIWGAPVGYRILSDDHAKSVEETRRPAFHLESKAGEAAISTVGCRSALEQSVRNQQLSYCRGLFSRQPYGSHVPKTTIVSAIPNVYHEVGDQKGLYITRISGRDL